jgi:hypothetical protein
VDLDSRVTTEVNGFTFVKGDFNQTGLVPSFDVIVACSAIEHFGLPGRYGSAQDWEGDLKAMEKIQSLLSPKGQAFITVPVGSDAVHLPWHRVYGRKRLPLLLQGFTVAEARFWAKNHWGPWYETTLSNALNQPVEIQRYALGQFILAVDCKTEDIASARLT